VESPPVGGPPSGRFLADRGEGAAPTCGLIFLASLASRLKAPGIDWKGSMLFSYRE